MNIEAPQRSPQVWNSLQELERYASSEKWAGFDPYDALNSPFLRVLGFNKPVRIAIIQLFRRSPLNVRPLFGIKKGWNPKGMGLFLSGYVKLYRITGDQVYLDRANWIADWLLQNKAEGYTGDAWGYNFDWQSRALFVPGGTPTMVNTSFIGGAFLDMYDLARQPDHLNTAKSACEFLLSDLNRWQEKDSLALSYTPVDSTRVHNANMLGAALLARVYRLTHEERYRESARRMVHYVMSCQREDGSWYYAETDIQRWIDSFHTGFILESLHQYIRSSGDESFQPNLINGLAFYRKSFFSPDGIAYYYHDHSGPIDIHSFAQAIVTLTLLAAVDQECRRVADAVLRWVLNNMQSPSGYFYFRKGRWVDNRIPYIRWAQAWMFHALTTLLYDDTKKS